MIVNVVFVGMKPTRVTVNTQEPQNRFSVSGEGRVSAAPDIALMSFGVTTERSTVAQATKENTAKMNAVIAAVKSKGVADKDIRSTQYQLNPVYEYPVGGRAYIRGYSISQMVEVKMRDFDTIGDVVAAATDVGANQAGSLQFTIDKPEDLQAVARKEAIEKAKAKAKEIADESGLRLGRLMNVSEGGNTPTPVPMYAKAYAMDAMSESAPTPDIQAGEQEIVVNVTLTYEVE